MKRMSDGVGLATHEMHKERCAGHRMYAVVTVSRRLEKVTAALRKRIIADLRAAGLSKGEAQKLLELDVRDIGVDVRRSLAQERPAGTF